MLRVTATDVEQLSGFAKGYAVRQPPGRNLLRDLPSIIVRCLALASVSIADSIPSR